MHTLKTDSPFDLTLEIEDAENRIRKHIRETPLEFSGDLSQRGNSQVFLKLENLQISGSFKLRGALNKLLSLSESQKKKGVLTASSGNHGLAVAYGLNKFHIDGKIFLPSIASPAKVEALREHGVEIELYGDDCIEAERKARQTATEENKEYISPYNDPKIIGGQGTVAVELDRQLERIHSVLVPVGGGGLISGISGYLKNKNPNVEIFGCQPENSAVMFESLKQGYIIEMESLPTLSDGSAGGIEKDSVTFDFCRDFVDDFVLLTEQEIKEAIRLIFEKFHMIIEGAAALPVAAYLKEKKRFGGKNVVLILSGSKLSCEDLQSVFGKD